MDSPQDTCLDFRQKRHYYYADKSKQSNQFVMSGVRRDKYVGSPEDRKHVVGPPPEERYFRGGLLFLWLWVFGASDTRESSP